MDVCGRLSRVQTRVRSDLANGRFGVKRVDFGMSTTCPVSG